MISIFYMREGVGEAEDFERVAKYQRGEDEKYLFLIVSLVSLFVCFLFKNVSFFGEGGHSFLVKGVAAPPCSPVASPLVTKTSAN